MGKKYFVIGFVEVTLIQPRPDVHHAVVLVRLRFLVAFFRRQSADVADLRV